MKRRHGSKQIWVAALGLEIETQAVYARSFWNRGANLVSWGGEVCSV